MDANIKRDEGIDLMSLIQEKKEDIPMDTPNPVPNTSEPPKEKVVTDENLTPAQQMIRDRQKGIVVDNKKLAEGNDKSVRSTVDSDDRLNNYDETLKSMDDLIVKQSYVVMKNTKHSSQEEAQMMTAMAMDELSSMDLAELQKLSDEHPEGAKLRSKYFDLAPKSQRERKNSPDKEVIEKAEEVGIIKKEPSKEAVAEKPTTLAVDQPDTIDNGPDEEEEVSPSKERETLVRVLIDKTNLGIPPIFDEVEKDKILTADQVDIVEVETVELKSTTFKKPKKSFLESVSGYESHGVNIPMTFPCSRFRATMRGLTYGEMTDVALVYQDITYERVLKKLTIIYNKMNNISCGGFDSFDEFLDNFSYADIPLATYGLYIASSPEKDTIGLRCGNTECDKNFRWNFKTRSLLQMDMCSDAFLNAMKEVVDVSGNDARELFMKAPHKNEKIFKLPNTGWLIHVAYATCREYLDLILKNNDIEEFRKTHPDDINGTKQSGIVFLQLIRAISIPDEDGTYERYDDVSDILEAIYSMNLDDLRIMSEIVDRYNSEYTVTFGVRNVVCPHCQTKTALVNVDIDELVFRAYQRRLSTNVNLASLGDL